MLLYNLRFVPSILNSDKTEEPRLTPEMFTAHGIDHTERRATKDVALPLRSGRGRAGDWRETKQLPKDNFRQPGC